jgi:hypothetical protein
LFAKFATQELSALQAAATWWPAAAAKDAAKSKACRMNEAAPLDYCGAVTQFLTKPRNSWPESDRCLP